MATLRQFDSDEPTYHDMRFPPSSTILVSGPSQCGKTYWLANVLASRETMFNPPPREIVFFYRVWQPLYEDLLAAGAVDEFVQGVPEASYAKKLGERNAGRGGSIICIDDQMLECDGAVAALFSVYSHHHEISVFYVTQNMFAKTPHWRTISLSAQGMVCFKAPRDSSSIKHLARQISPSDPNHLVEAYRHATRRPRGYLYIDLRQNCADRLRYRTNLLPQEQPMLVYCGTGREEEEEEEKEDGI
jgi:hypothetical protein